LPGFEEEDPNHFLNIDAREYGTYRFWRCRVSMVRRFRNLGSRVFVRHGTLPWRIEEFHGNLRRAFDRVQAVNGRFDIVLMSAALGHYVSDATQPFHTVSKL
jgi:hypothetical protein